MGGGQKNPFKPTAGATPPLLVGRQDVLDEWVESLDNGPGAPGRITIYTGARGVGKTVMLNEVATLTSAKGWLVIHETAEVGFLDRIHSTVKRVLSDEDPPGKREITNVTMPLNLGGIGTSLVPESPSDLRSDLTTLLTQLAEHETGLLLTLDEISDGSDTEMIRLATITQHMVREEREFALAMAGLSGAVDSLLNGNTTTFMRRADKHTLKEVPVAEVGKSLTEAIRAADWDIEDTAVNLLAKGTGGYPFLIQLVGYHAWSTAAGTEENIISQSSAERGIQKARRRFGALVQEPALSQLSQVDKTFLSAMAIDDGPSKMADVIERMRVSRDYATMYRSRLLAAQLITAPGYGVVTFALPYLREYLREHAATLGIQIPQPE